MSRWSNQASVDAFIDVAGMKPLTATPCSAWLRDRFWPIMSNSRFPLRPRWASQASRCGLSMARGSANSGLVWYSRMMRWSLACRPSWATAAAITRSRTILSSDWRCASGVSSSFRSTPG